MPTTTTTTTTTTIVIAGAGNEAEKLMDQGSAEKECVAMMRASATGKKKGVLAKTMPMPHAILLLVAVLLAVSLEVAEGGRNKRPDPR